MMTKAIYIATVEPNCGKSLVSLGLAEMILRRTPRVGIFRPVIRGSQIGRDKNIDLLLTHFDLAQNYEDTYGFFRADAANLISRGRYDDALDHVIQRYKAVESQYDFIICIGSDLEGVGALFEYDINADIARNLGTPVLLVGTAAGRSVDEVVNTISMSLDHYVDRGCDVIGTIVNRADIDQVQTLQEALEREVGDKSRFI
jgi:phosphate acetyltransferase